LKFSDAIMAVATVAVIDFLVYFVLGIALIPSVGSYLGLNSAAIVSVLVAALAAGCVFAGSIQEESRIRAVGKIAVLFAAVTGFAVMISLAANGYYSTLVKETLQSAYSTGSWSTTDWFVYEQLALAEQVAFNVLLALVLGFIGLYWFDAQEAKEELRTARTVLPALSFLVFSRQLNPIILSCLRENKIRRRFWSIFLKPI
jgi:hypothetical protein